MFSEAKVGDRVWSIAKGWGTIEAVEQDTKYYPYPLEVLFDKEGIGRIDFMVDGREDEEDERPSLFWDEVYIEAPPAPKQKAKKEGWINLYKDTDGVFTSLKVYQDKMSALKGAASDVLDTLKIEWYEYE